MYIYILYTHIHQLAYTKYVCELTALLTIEPFPRILEGV